MAPGMIQPSLSYWNTQIVRNVKAGLESKALEIFQQMLQGGINPNKFTFPPLLKACAKLTALEEGRQVHAETIRSGCELDLFVGNSLVDMYAKCGSLDEACNVFQKMQTHDTVSWNALIMGHVKCGQAKEALRLFQRMQSEQMEPDKFSFVGALHACARLVALDEGRHVHSQITQSRCELDGFVGNALIDMYAKCGSITEACRVFHAMHTHNVVSWNSIILGNAKCGKGKDALELFQQMQREKVKPNGMTFVGALNACASILALEEGRHVHAVIMQSEVELDVFVGSSLIDMYAKCGSMEDACRVFHSMRVHNVVSWNALILGQAIHGHGNKALQLFKQMQKQGVKPNSITFVGALTACASLAAVDEGRHVHSQFYQSGIELDVFVGNSLVNMYAKCGSIEEACKVFHEMKTHNIVSWNTMIMGHAKCGQGKKALEVFHQMQREEMKPNAATFIGALSACTSLSALDEGRCVHAQILESEYELDMFLMRSLIDMYATCGSIEESYKLFCKLQFYDAVVWNAMIMGLSKCGQGKKALELFKHMQLEGVKPDKITYVGAVCACTNVGALEEGRCVHNLIIQSGCELDVFVGNSLVDMYAKCGSIEEACRVFHSMPEQDVVSWNSIIMGHAKCGKGREGMQLFQEMQRGKVKPDCITFLAAINLCASVPALQEGRHIHEQMRQYGFGLDVFVGNALVDMYAKCGSLEEACKVFASMPSRDIVTWNAMIGGYALHGLGKEAIQTFHEMHQNGVKVDSVTFVCLLLACSHAGLVNEGLHYFNSMTTVYGLPAKVEHYSCMVDLLGRAGHLEEAESIIRQMQCAPNVCVWMALLGACRIHGNVAIAERVAEKVLTLKPKTLHCMCCFPTSMVQQVGGSVKQKS